jgi:hypothetical protein
METRISRLALCCHNAPPIFVAQPLLAVRCSYVIPTEVPRFFFPAALWRARDAGRDLLSAALLTATEKPPIAPPGTRAHTRQTLSPILK